MRRNAGLRSEVLLTLTLLMGAALLFGGVLLLRLSEKSLLEQRVVQLNALTQTLGMAMSQAHAGVSLEKSELMQRLPQELGVAGWWIYDRNLELLHSDVNGDLKPFTQPRLQQAKLLQDLQREISFPSLLDLSGSPQTFAHYAVPLLEENRFRGILEIHFSLDDIRYRLLFSQKVIFAYVVCYGIVLVLIGYYLLQRNVISPARNLLKATEAVGRGSLETRLPVAGPQEIASLADAYNKMVEALQQSRNETQSHIDMLQKTNLELKQARDELIRSEKLASVGQLAAGLAHELGNPLAALIGYLEILKNRLSADDSEIVSCSLTEAERIDFLVRELLDFSRPSSDCIEELDPVEILRDTVGLLQRQGALDTIKVIDRLPDESDAVRMSRHKLQQLYVNLLLNAVHACSGEGAVTLSADNIEGSLSIQIEDSGCGIEPEELDKIFEPFYTSKKSGEGTGLGLAICHRIVDEAGGKISVDSKVSVGSLFRIDLPVV
ncbi:HAMP domain-containing protein [Malonomonas rubra DSM 5091]|uniref:histidine kinase n=1 Tax=Malonomonas rubra DSM 5091 TaxID=1122189 RepID=A0A1M6BLS7_MALRU|nr:ATP-binding protein [Malonomonas rubra]SHI49662.1 HAMP domain-containing protein [Malonomonas rubra DSM 5091]